jgi:hypothetical protein
MGDRRFPLDVLRFAPMQGQAGRGVAVARRPAKLRPIGASGRGSHESNAKQCDQRKVFFVILSAAKDLPALDGEQILRCAQDDNNFEIVARDYFHFNNSRSKASADLSSG